jgi:hypothetical protein
MGWVQSEKAAEPLHELAPILAANSRVQAVSSLCNS